MHVSSKRSGAMVAGVIAVACGGIATLGIAPGCGGGVKQTAPPTPNDGLIDLRQMLRSKTTAGEPVPSSQEDFRALDAAFPAAGRFLGTGAIQYVWGARLADTPDADRVVVAHETAAPTAGGFVLLQSGSIRHVTPEEFAKLAKAKPAS